jgi:MoxR-like ATPase
VQAILKHTRESANYVHGLSPRAGLSLLAAARAWALLDGRNAVLPEDVQAVLPSVAKHRLQNTQSASDTPSNRLLEELITAVAIP